jgi:hypothetical protein
MHDRVGRQFVYGQDQILGPAFGETGLNGAFPYLSSQCEQRSGVEAVDHLIKAGDGHDTHNRSGVDDQEDLSGLAWTCLCAPSVGGVW